MKKINHKGLWFDSMSGMTLGFIATLIIGTIIGIFGLYSSHNIFITIKKAMTFITTFGIGVGIAIKHKLKPLQIFTVGITTMIIGRSLMTPKWIEGSINFTNIDINIDMKFFHPGDVFAAWLSGVGMLYIFEWYVKETTMDIFLLPIIGIFIGVFGALWITYLTSLVTVFLELIIKNTINDKLWTGLLIAPIFGMIMGLSLSLPTSSAAIAVALGLHGDAAIIAIAATSSQMIAFGMMTYIHTKNISKSLAVGFGTSMLQINNYIKKPVLLVIPTIVSMVSAIMALGIFHGELGFEKYSPTSGMGSSSMYGQIFTLKENGWSNTNAWLNVIFIQLLLPAAIVIPMSMYTLKKGIINKMDLVF